MLPPRNSIGRIAGATRPLRYPRNCHLANTSQHLRFTTKSRLELISPPPGRPQLGFLSLPTNRALPPLSIHLRQHFARLISTEAREHYKRRLSRGLRIGLSFYAILVLFQVIKLGVYQEEIEHKWPTPPEWSWKSRWCLRSAQAVMHPEEIGKLMTNWPMVAGYCKELYERLEDVEFEGKGIIEQGDGGFLVEGVGKTGFDIEAKSEPWRRGYFQTLMCAAKAAESLEGWMTDRKQRISAPKEYVVGPSNPRPRPMPAGNKKVPREEDCEIASPSPEVFYMKILTTKGFDERQKLDAALAYADWLDYKGLQQTAGDMYGWAMDIAAAGSDNASTVVDLKTGILKNNTKTLPSENILRVSTALAVHQARQGNLPTALSIFTSILKARRSIPLIPSTPSLSLSPPKTNDPFAKLFNTVKTTLIPVEYPAPLPSGNDPPIRDTTSLCDEAGLMTYIGEIIFAAHSKETGLAWTRDAVDIAESTLLDLTTSSNTPSTSPSNSRSHCTDCLKIGLANWKTMVSSLITQSRKAELASIENAKKAWYGGQRDVEAKSLERKRWEAEMMILEERIRNVGPVVGEEFGVEGSFAPEGSIFV